MNRFIDWLWVRRLRRLPHFRSPKMLELPQNQRVLLFAPHSDDEWIGCGGTLSLLKTNQCDIRVVVLTDGTQGDPEHFFSGDIGKKRQGETREVLGALGIDDLCFLNYPDGDLGGHVDTMSRAVAKLYDEFDPDWVLTTSFTEHHRDHVCTAYVVTRHWLSRGRRERLLAYEIYGSIRADWVVDITSVMTLKREMIRRYKIPLRYIDYEAACVSVARFRGILVGNPLDERFAEAFMEIRPSDVLRDVLGELLDGRQ